MNNRISIRIVLDEYGYNYPLRAVHSGPYLGGNTAQEALYPNTYAAADNKPLSGANRYVFSFKSEPPVDAFWSLTIYDAVTKMLVDNPINRYKVGSDTAGRRSALTARMPLSSSMTNRRTRRTG